MVGTLLRVFVGFLLAAFVAGLVLVLHADTPADIMARSGGGFDAGAVTGVLELALKAGTHIAIFAAPLALIAAAIAEWQGARSAWYYLLAGLAIAGGGFMAQHASEAAGQQTVLNDYAVRAFGLAGLLAGAVYWMVAGRFAGGVPEETTAEALSTAERHAAPSKKPRDVVDAEVAPSPPRPAATPAAGAASAKAAPPKPEAVKAEPGKPEPAKSEAAKPEAGQDAVKKA